MLFLFNKKLLKFEINNEKLIIYFFDLDFLLPFFGPGFLQATPSLRTPCGFEAVLALHRFLRGDLDPLDLDALDLDALDLGPLGTSLEFALNTHLRGLVTCLPPRLAHFFLEPPLKLFMLEFYYMKYYFNWYDEFYDFKINFKHKV